MPSTSLHPNLRVLNPLEFEIKDTRFRIVLADFDRYKTTKDEIVVLKPLEWFGYYADLIRNNNVSSILELGIFEGGSAILFGLMFDHLRIVSIDNLPPAPAAMHHIVRLGLLDRVTLRFGVSQDDRSEMEKIVTTEFAPPVIDMVIDDASHQYAASRASFEILFPFLRQAGVYVIEDWAWAHWPGIYQEEKWLDRPALSNLLFELAILAGRRPDLIERIDIRAGTLAAFKNAAPDIGGFKLDENLLMRGRKLSLI
jgi:cephalosporin hydroxylase